MRITESQALSIVRTYHKQLKVGTLDKASPSNNGDSVALSAEARRLGNGTASESAPANPVHVAASSIETRVKSHTDIVMQRNLPFE